MANKYHRNQLVNSIVRGCPVCNCEVFTPGSLGLLMCDSCGLIVSPAIWNSQANKVSEEEWFGETYQPESSFWVTYFEDSNNRRTLRRLTAGTACRGRLLEIGVGSGSFLRAAQEKGFNVMGCDLSPVLCRRVAEKYDILMHCGLLSSIKGDGQFDVIVMNHVLEHVQHPVSFLQDVNRLLSPQGVVHIALPNVGCWEARLPGWTSYEPYHLSYFTPITLRQTILNGGLQIKQMYTHESFSGWFLAVLRTLMNVNSNDRVTNLYAREEIVGEPRRRSSLIEHGYRVTTIITGFALWPLRQLQAWLQYGDELICLAGKSS